MDDILRILIERLEKEDKIIAKETGKEYAHLTFADGRQHTLMRMKAWAKTQIKQNSNSTI